MHFSGTIVSLVSICHCIRSSSSPNAGYCFKNPGSLYRGGISKINFITNNKIKEWNEYDKLKDLPELSSVSVKGNPSHDNVGNVEPKF